MSVTIQVAGYSAEVQDGVWTAETDALRRAAEAIALNHQDAPGYRQDDPDWHYAQEVARVLGGEVVGRNTPPPASQPGRVY